MTSFAPVRLVVVVVTYQRPRLLAVALDAVVAQAVPDGVELDVVVVDNDPQRSAQPVATEVGARYVSEPRPGLAAVRNAALDAARGAALIQMIDDDEEPAPGWLDAMVRCWRAYAPTAVAGPVERPLSGAIDPWVVASGFFASPPVADGTLRSGARSGNLLLDLAQVQRLELRFDERFSFSGGEDTMFAQQLLARGGSIRWCADGVVVEPQPPQRTTRTWVLARARRTANSWSRVQLALAGGGLGAVRRRLWLTAHVVVIAGRGLRRVVQGRLHRSLSATAGGEIELAKARGALAGAWGRVIDEYRRPVS